MDAPHTPGEAPDPTRDGHDLSALAWVHAELRRSLEAANKALRRFLKEAEAAAGSDLNAVDLAVLRSARAQLHQGVGALELVGLPAPAALLRAAESAVQRMVAKPALVTPAAVSTVEKASFALLDFLGRQLAGKPLSPVALFPQYRAAQQLAGAERVHPADLWPHVWQWKPLPAEPGVLPRAADGAARSAMESLVLTLMRQPEPAALLRMSDLCAGLAAGARMGADDEAAQLATLWQLAAAVFQAQAAGLLGSDVYTKRLASRLLAQLKAGARGDQPPSERLAQDLLFFCAHARPWAAPDGGATADPAPRLAAVRRAWQLDEPGTGSEALADYETARLGRFDPALVALAKKRVAGAKDAWSAVAGQELHRLVGLAEQFALVGDSVQRLFPAGEQMSRALQSAAAQTVAAADAPPPALAMEVATAVLYLDACIEDGEFDHPALAERVQHLAQRIDQVREGADPEPLEPWMEELYRRVSDRQTMGSVVQELRASLSDVEKQIDQYFRHPAQREVLIPVPGQLSAMRGVLSVLGMEQASQAVLHMRDDVAALAETEVDPQQAIATGTFDRLADNLGALSFLIDMLSVQPQLAKSLFRFDADTGSLSAVMGQSERVSAFSGLDEAPAALAAADGGALPQGAAEDFTLDLRPPAAAQSTAAAALPPLSDLGVAAGAVPAAAPEPAPQLAAVGSTGLEDDAEMREIFVEEAREVVGNASAALARLADAPEVASDMTELRRAFHTLKGSSRMVGLREFGEAAWGCEQLFNARLAHGARMDGVLRQFTTEALAYLGGWTEAIAMGRDDGHRAPPVQQAADALRLDNRRVALAPPVWPLPATATEAVEPAGTATAPPELQDLPTLPELPELPQHSFAAELPPTLADLSAETAETAETTAEAATDRQDEPPPPEPVYDSAAAEELPPCDTEPEPPMQATVTLPVVSELAPTDEAASETAVEASAPGGLVFEFDLDLDLDPGDAAAETAVQPLEAVAADSAEFESVPLEATQNDGDSAPTEPAALSPVEAAPEAAPALEPAPAPLDFSFDLGALDAAAEAESDAETGAGAEAVPAAEAVPDEQPQDEKADTADTADTAEADAPPAQPLLVTLAGLIERVPDLPSAADLDLGEAPITVAAPGSEPEPGLPGLPEIEFELAPDAGAEADAEAESTGGIPPVAAGAAQEMSLDDAAMARLFDTAPADAAEGAEGAETADTADAAEASGFAAAVEDSPPEPQASAQADDSEDQVKLIGPLRISIPLFNIFLNEADEQSRRLCTDMAEWALEQERHAVPESSVALAHSLAGNSATVGFADLSALARALEHALMRSQLAGYGREGESELFLDAAEDIRRLLHQFAAGFLRPVQPGLMDRLAEHERLPVPPDAEDTSGPAATDAAEMSDLGEGIPAPAAQTLDLESPAAPEPEPESWPVLPAAEAPWPQPETEPDFEPEVERSASASIFDTLSSGRGPGAGLAPVVVSDFLPLVADEAGPGARADAFDDDEDIDAVDNIDTELWPIFEEEAEELLPQLQGRLRDWHDAPADPGGPSACMRTLHTLKGGARLAGAMRLGEMAHRLETAIEHLSAHPRVAAADIEPLLARADAMSAVFETLGRPAAAPAVTAAAVEAVARVEAPREAPRAVPIDAAEPTLPAAAHDTAAGLASEVEPGAAELANRLAGTDEAPAAGGVEAVGADEPAEAEPSVDTPGPAADAATPDAAPVQALLPGARIDWSRFSLGDSAPLAVADRAGSNAAVRVRAGLLDRLVNQAGEVSITRARIDADMRQLQVALGELTDSLDRMRRQLRDIELQAETQMSSRLEAAKAASAAFDPLEMDRFTRFQELTRFMAESVNDVATLQRGLQRTLQSTEDELAAQARLTRELQDDLLRTRMVEFESLADRLYRTVRQAAKDAGKQVRLDIVGGAIEVDRGVLERMIGPFEHLLRNSVAHGIEVPQARSAAGKDAAGHISITLTQAGNEVAVEFADDGAGLDLPRIRRRALERGLLAADATASDAELAQLIFAPGFSTAEQVTELAGRGVGMDVVRAEVNAMGGRIETATSPGQGTRFRLLLPLTTAVTQVVMLRCGELSVAVPSTLIEIVRRLPSAEVEAAYTQGHLAFGGEDVPFFWLPALLQQGTRGEAPGRTQAVVVVRSAAQRVALHVDEVTANQEVVVKNVGSQLSRLPGLAGVTLLPSGAVALIYNPVALATLYGDEARHRALGQHAAPAGTATAPVLAAPPRAPLVLVVDDSLTVRRVTQRLLVREGYRVTTAKDGLDALEKLADERPAVLLSDIEMPRMDGFDLLRNVRADPALAGLPVVMITSRTAQKHRELAAELGADHYLGKPYGEEELLSFVAQHAGAVAPDILT